VGAGDGDHNDTHEVKHRISHSGDPEDEAREPAPLGAAELGEGTARLESS